jgi:hypothetical protein
MVDDLEPNNTTRYHYILIKLLDNFRPPNLLKILINENSMLLKHFSKLNVSKFAVKLWRLRKYF